MIPNSEVSLCVDALLVETVLADNRFYKRAGFIADVLSRIKGEIMGHIDKEHPVASVLKILAPGALWLFMQSIGLGKWGFLLGLLTDYFHVDIPGMLKSMFDKVKDSISSGKKSSSEQIDQAANEVAQEHATAANPADDHRVYTSLELLDEARFIRLALIEYEHQKMRLVKEGTDVNNFLDFGGAKSKTTSLFAKIVGWIFKIVLASAGLMVAGDAIHALMGEPSALTGTYQEGKTPESGSTEPSESISKQTKFPSKGDSPLPGSWPIVANSTNISNMLVQFAKDTYSGLDGKESLIQSLPAFQAVRDNIAWFNVHNEGSAVTLLPSNLRSKKKIVDFFIDDVAKAS